MNANAKFQLVPPIFVEKCMEYGKSIVNWYNGPGQNSRSRSVSGSWGAENNITRQAQSKAGEVAAALYFDLEPNIAVKWEVGYGGDGGLDLKIADGTEVDVKTTLRGWKLIWSKAVNHLYWHPSKQFDVLVAVSIEETNLSQCWLEGWISKQDFYDQKQISNGYNAGRLEAGTWFLDKERLLNIAELYEPQTSSQAQPEILNPAPDLHALIRQFGTYSAIPPEAWKDWDERIANWRAATRRQ